MKTAAIALTWLIFATFNQVQVLEALVPKQVLKRGLMAFIQEISHKPISDQNLCFVVFESWVEALLDRQSTLEEAFDTTFTVDLTHTFAKGTSCQKAFNKFTEEWKTFQMKDTKVIINLCNHTYLQKFVGRRTKA